jgi:hypothetical protein
VVDRRATNRVVAGTVLLCVMAALPGCGDGSSSGTAKAEAHFVTLANMLCREQRQRVLGPSREARVNRGLDEFEVLVNAPHKPARIGRYVSDLYANGGESPDRAAAAKVYADQKALGLTNCLRQPPSKQTGPTTEAVPNLSRAQVRRGIRIMSKSHVLAALLHRVPYHIAHLGTWSTGGEDNKLIGIVFWLNLAHPTNMIGYRPQANEESGSPPYLEQSRYFRAQAVQSLTVSVDLARGVVAEIVPTMCSPTCPR